MFENFFKNIRENKIGFNKFLFGFYLFWEGQKNGGFGGGFF